MNERYVSVRRAAETLGLSEQTIRRMLVSGRLAGTIRVGRAVRIPVSALERMPEYEPPSSAIE